MRIATFGAFRTDDDYRGTKEQFEAACQSIGAAIAERGHTLVVASDSPSTADYHVVIGYLNGVDFHRIQRPRIEILKRPSDPHVFEGLAMENPSIFHFKNSISDSWHITHLQVLNRADSVLLVGGGRNTFYSGLAAITARKRVVPIGAFGGAGAELLKEIASFGDALLPNLPSSTHQGVLLGPWTRHQEEVVIQALGLSEYPKLMIIHGRSQDWRELRYILAENIRIPSPIIMGEEFRGGLTLPEKLENLASIVDGAIALITPDDIAEATFSGKGQPLRIEAREKFFRARQNVWLEVGWFWGRLGREKILLLIKEALGENSLPLELPSDLSGIVWHNYQGSPQDAVEAIQSFIDMLRGGKNE